MKQLFVYICTVLVMTISSVVAQAGDYAERRIIGFSDNGKYFAFEQFGIQDGSGFPYSNIFIIDTDTDSWAGGSPFRTRLQDDQATLPMARSQNVNKALNSLQSLGIRNPGRILSSNPPTEAGNNAHAVQFNNYVNIGPVKSLNISESNHTAANCTDLGVQIKGFTLAFDAGNGQPPTTLHHDNAVPSSRNCPVGYGISDVILFEVNGGASRMVVLVNVFSYGFEGPDRRFIAIPAILN